MTPVPLSTLASTPSRPLTAARAAQQLVDKQQLAQRLYQQQLARQQATPPGYGFMAPSMPSFPPRAKVANGDWPKSAPKPEWGMAPREGKAAFKFNRDAPPFVARTITPPSKPLAPIGRPVDDPSVLLTFPPRGISPPPIERAPLLDADRSGWLSMSGGLFNLSNIWQPKLGLDTTTAGDDWAEHGFTIDDGEGDDGGDDDGHDEGEKADDQI